MANAHKKVGHSHIAVFIPITVYLPVYQSKHPQLTRETLTKKTFTIDTW